jgi:hypothetical protein
MAAGGNSMKSCAALGNCAPAAGVNEEKEVNANALVT